MGEPMYMFDPELQRPTFRIRALNNVQYNLRFADYKQLRPKSIKSITYNGRSWYELELQKNSFSGGCKPLYSTKGEIIGGPIHVYFSSRSKHDLKILRKQICYAQGYSKGQYIYTFSPQFAGKVDFKDVLSTLVECD